MSIDDTAEIFPQADPTDAALREIMSASIDFAKTKLGAIGAFELEHSRSDIIAKEPDWRLAMRAKGLSQIVWNGQTFNL